MDVPIFEGPARNYEGDDKAEVLEAISNIIGKSVEVISAKWTYDNTILPTNLRVRVKAPDGEIVVVFVVQRVFKVRYGEVEA